MMAHLNDKNKLIEIASNKIISIIATHPVPVSISHLLSHSGNYLEELYSFATSAPDSAELNIRTSSILKLPE